MSRPLLRPIAALVLCALPLAAGAHVGADGAHHGLAAGFTHPFTGLDHLLAMLVVGLWSGLAVRRAWLAPLGFASMVLVGALLAAAGLPLPAIEPMIALSLVALGLLLARRVALPGWAAFALAGGFALFHGAAHGQELQGAAALAGMVAATALLHVGGLGLGLWLRERSLWWSRLSGWGTGLVGLALLVGAV